MASEKTAAGKVTVPEIMAMKKRGEKIACLTAYDYLMATLLDRAGVDLILVGDSVGMVVAGYKTTIPVTMDAIIYHTQAVARGIRRALLVTDMPFLSFQVSIEKTVENAGRCLKEGGAEAVKLEGGAPMAETIRRLVDLGIPVMGHLGLTPQSINKFGGYRLRAKDKDEAKRLLTDAKILQEAGVFSIVLEKVPAALAKKVTENVQVPTIGIGAGPDCDGQILVTHDMLGLFEEFKPKFVRRYVELGKAMRSAFEQYVADVKESKFPSLQESY
ncbi:MAG TPA: 3-methyl-2-oxobutanoate hydroxymethyltransferase [Deltaproteobacteria bacterium]|nr:3-methyl-2-oxobutanoate hydroxymethyltransferase [Deltaproteobacteria bacterium]